MKNSTSSKLLALASICLSLSSVIFLCLSLFGCQKPWTLPVALGCVTLSMLFQLVFKQNGK